MTEERLREVRGAYKEQKQLKEKIMEFESMRTSPRSAVYGAERVQSSAKGDVQLDSIIALDRLLERYNAQLQKCVALTMEFEEALEVLNSRERRMMRLYYIDGLTWEKVCVEMNVSWAQHDRIKKKIKAKLVKKGVCDNDGRALQANPEL